jgi:hypothetical protein
MAKYTPPEQSKALQFVDVIFLLAAIFIALWLPLKLGLAGAAKSMDKIDNPTWETLQQLGYDAVKAHDEIQNHFHYVIDWRALIVMAFVIIGYFVFVFRASDKEYRDVIAEKFGDGK